MGATSAADARGVGVIRIANFKVLVFEAEVRIDGSEQMAVRAVSLWICCRNGSYKHTFKNQSCANVHAIVLCLLHIIRSKKEL